MTRFQGERTHTLEGRAMGGRHDLAAEKDTDACRQMRSLGSYSDMDLDRPHVRFRKCQNVKVQLCRISIAFGDLKWLVLCGLAARFSPFALTPAWINRWSLLNVN